RLRRGPGLPLRPAPPVRGHRRDAGRRGRLAHRGVEGTDARRRLRQAAAICTPSRLRKAAAACRDTGAAGRNEPSTNPVGIPAPAAQAGPLQNGGLTGTSGNGAAGQAGTVSSANRVRKAAAACRDTGAAGRNEPSTNPVVIPAPAAQAISLQNGWLTGTSV